MAALAVCVLGIIITLLSWHVDRQRAREEQQAQISEQVRSVETAVASRLEANKQILLGVIGLFAASETVERAEFSRFVEQYKVQTYPGVAVVGYMQYVPAPASEEFVKSVQASGLSDFKIWPEGPRAEYAPITYIESFPGAASTAYGYDMLSNPARLEPILTARDTGGITFSRKDKLVTLEEKNQEGFLMFAPVYRKGSKPANEAERRAAIQGFVYANFKGDSFFTVVLDQSRFPAYREVQVFDGPNPATSSVLYQTADFSKYTNGEVSDTYPTNTLGTNWTYRFADLVNPGQGASQRSELILFGGITLSLAVAGFLFLIMLTRARAIVYSKAQESQQAKDDLLSLASHQLRTPASAVKQYLGMILEGYTGSIKAKQLPVLQKAYISNERQLETINQILYVAKADAGRLSIHKEHFDLNSLVDDMAAELIDQLAESKQKLVVEKNRKNLRVYADEGAIRMVLENLVTNAGKYSYPRSRVLIKTGTSGGMAYVCVEDQGVGIGPEDYDKLFKKFSRIDNDLSLQAGGSGIGLYIDKVLIELHGGRIEVESEVDIGSTFTVFLPLDKGG